MVETIGEVRKMKLCATLEIDSEGILKQMEKVRRVNTKMREKIDELQDMLRSFNITEQRDSKEPLSD